MELIFFSSDGWQSWDVQRRPVFPDGMSVLVDDDLAFEDASGPRPATLVNQWLRELPSSGCPAPSSWESYARVLRSWMKFIVDFDVNLFDERRPLKDALSAYAVHRACGPVEARFEVTTWDRHVSVLSSFYRWAVAEGHAQAEPFTYAQARTLYGDQVRDRQINLAVRRRPKAHVTIKYLGQDFEALFLKALAGLPPRDERLVALESWIARTIQDRDDLAERQILYGYAVWHHLRRLRQRLGEHHATRLQDLNVRCHVTAAAGFLDWLSARGRALADCTQADLDTWTVGGHRYRDETAHFVRWAVTHKHAHGLTFGATRWHGPAGPLDTEKRWADARRLLHDDTLTTADRVAGLLILLYAQRIATITQLTADDIHDTGGTVAITFGRVPVALPEPLAALVRELVATRKGGSIIPAPDTKPWLFLGKRPGHPVGDDALGNRLQRIGLNPRQDRSTALFSLATELPAAMLARMLGIHIAVAVQWQ